MLSFWYCFSTPRKYRADCIQMTLSFIFRIILAAPGPILRKMEPVGGGRGRERNQRELSPAQRCQGLNFLGGSVCVSPLCVKCTAGTGGLGSPAQWTIKLQVIFSLLLPDSRRAGVQTSQTWTRRNLYSSTFPGSRPLRNPCDKSRAGFHDHQAELSVYAGLIYKWLEKMSVFVHSPSLGTCSPNPEVSPHSAVFPIP